MNNGRNGAEAWPGLASQTRKGIKAAAKLLGISQPQGKRQSSSRSSPPSTTPQPLLLSAGLSPSRLSLAGRSFF